MRILLIVYDNESYIHWFPAGTAYIASALRQAGHEVEIYSQDVHHWPGEHLTDFLNNNKYDMVGLGVIAGYFQYRKMMEISEAINKSNKRPFFVLGGHGPSPEPEYFLNKTGADAVVIGEGELTIAELTEAVSDGRSLEEIKGIAFRREDAVQINMRRELIEDVDSIAMPAYDLFPIDYYRLARQPHAESKDFIMPIISGRGCKFKCNFCYRMDKGFRPRSGESIIEEIRYLNRNYGVNYIYFNDELLMSSEQRTEELCTAFLNSGLKFKWGCNGRLNYAKPKTLRLMKNAGCVFINYGIESMDDQALKNMNKALNTSQIIKGIEATLEVDISPGYNIIFGNIGETKQSLEKGVEFLLKYDDCSQMRTIRPVTPYPGSDLYYYAIEQGLLKDCADFYENKHLNSDLLAVNFTDLTDEQFHKCLAEANKRLIENYYAVRSRKAVEQTMNLYEKKDLAFRGYRHT